MKAIAFITRVHPGRPSMLEKCVESVKTQTSDDYIHILRRDDSTEKGYGVPLANQSLRKIKTIDARYVMILDDDDMLVDPTFVETLARITKNGIPEVVFFKGEIIGQGIYPRPWNWKGKLRRGEIASFNLAVRHDVWVKYIHMFKPWVKGDFSFISCCYGRTRNHLWLDRMVVKTQQKPGRGCGEHAQS